jgi:hypothetical protein
VEENRDRREKRIIIDDLASYEEEIGVRRGMKRRGRLGDFFRNIFVGLLLVGIVVGSFWVSFLIGKRVLVPVKPLSSREITPIEEKLPEVEETEVLVIPDTSEVVEVPAKRIEPKPEPPEPMEKIKYYKVQAGLFTTKAKALSLVDRLKAKGFSSFIKKVGGTSFRVQVGAFRTKERAQTLVDQLKAKGFTPTVIYE